jgi:UDP-N-acetyl-D-galactosamine dehydrogenase
MLQKSLPVNGGRALILGLTFKENCPDLRNTRVVDIIGELQSFGMHVDVWDPWVDKAEAAHEYNITPIDNPEEGCYDCIVLAVSHKEFIDLGIDGIRKLGKPDAIVYDVKYLFKREETDGRL